MIVETPVGKYLAADGTLQSSSASAITTSDETTPFGCLRKAWFEVRAGLKGADTKSLEMGNLVHAQVEHYLKTKQDALGKEARAGKEMVDKIVERFPVYEVERWISELRLDGVLIRGRVDFTGRRLGDPVIAGIVDWKTSSDIAKWGKTPNQLRKDTQMLIYRAEAEREGCDENLYMAHAYFGTVKREAEIVQTSINRAQLSAGLDDIQKKLAVLKTAVKEVDSFAVKGDKSKCGRCPYSLHCTDKQGVVSVMSSLTDRFKRKPIQIEDKSAVPDVVSPAPTAPNAAPPAPPRDEIAELKAKLAAAEARASAPAVEQHTVLPVAVPAAPAPAPVQAGNIITPPDQPKSNPALAADPVPGFSPIPAPLKDTPPAPPEQHNMAAVPPAPTEEKRGRGRPPGARNKPKDVAKLQQMEDEAADMADGKFNGKSLQITRVKVQLGATVKFNPEDPKCFEFIRADVGMERDVVGGDEEVKVARQKLSDDCAQALVEELEKLKANTK